MRQKILLLFAFVLAVNFAFAQQADTSSAPATAKSKRVKNPTTAVYLSLALPGAGQVYNGKYWKVPLVYTGLGALAYSVYFNNYYYKLFLNDMIALQNGNAATVTGITDWDILKSNKDQARYNRDLSVLGFMIFWGLNVVDAYIDAEFSNFDVSDDLSFYLKPSVFEQPVAGYAPAITLGFTIKNYK